MKKKISFSTNGRKADIGDLTINRMLPNRYADAVGPFVFLDHLIPRLNPRVMNSGTQAHPHRGIATLSYILEGEAEHLDSAGNHGKINSGGIQWMKAGNGVIHDETLNVDSVSRTNRLHGFQFWINLPSRIKAEKPEYLTIQSNEVPQKALPDEGGSIKVIAGEYEDLRSKIPAYSTQFSFHISLKPGKSFTIHMDEKVEVAAFLPVANVMLNDAEFQAGEFVEFDREPGAIVIDNRLREAADILLFGGETYREPIVAEGPFVMNSKMEIADAYRDFFAGRYGELPPKGGL